MQIISKPSYTTHACLHQASVVWSRVDKTGGGWVSAQLSYSTPLDHFFILEAVPSEDQDTHYRGYTAVDNFSATEVRTFIIIKGGRGKKNLLDFGELLQRMSCPSFLYFIFANQEFELVASTSKCFVLNLLKRLTSSTRSLSFALKKNFPK